MDKKERRERVNAWRDRHPEMGVAAILCVPTGDRFLTATRDTATGFNRHKFQLSAGMHPNKVLQALWKEHGEGAFAYSTAKELEYEREEEVTKEDLDVLLELCLEEDPGAKKL